MKRRRASLGEVDYSQDRGVVSFTADWTSESSDLVPGCQSDVTWHVPWSAAPGPSRGLFNGSDFLLFFSLIGKDRGKYSLIAGEGQPELSNIHGKGTVRCPADHRFAHFRFDFTGAGNLPAVAHGKPGSDWLRGRARGGGQELNWILS